MSKQQDNINITEKVKIRMIYRESPDTNDKTTTTKTTTTTTKAGSGINGFAKIAYGLFDDEIPTRDSNTSSTTTSRHETKTMSCTKPKAISSKELPKSYSRGVAYGLFDKNDGKFKKGVGYSLFDKSFTEQKDRKFEVKKGQYGTYNKRAEMINFQVDEDVKMRPLDFEKGTYFTFGRMKEHLFFRYIETTNRNRHNNNNNSNINDVNENTMKTNLQSEDIVEINLMDAMMGEELFKLVCNEREDILENIAELDLESQMAKLSLYDLNH